MWLGLIPARGGSKGVPGKNVRVVGGVPLIGHAIACARRCPSIDAVVVSTDDEGIAAVARSCGADVPFRRPAELASDTAAMLPVIEHAIRECERFYGQPIEAVVLLDPTGPLRTEEDVEGAIARFRSGGCDAVVSGSPAHRNPYFNMVRERDDGFVGLACEPDRPIHRRQDAPVLYDLNTVVWVFSRRAVMEEKARLPKRTRLHVVPALHAVDVDTEDDLQLLEFLLERRRRASAGGRP